MMILSLIRYYTLTNIIICNVLSSMSINLYIKQNMSEIKLRPKTIIHWFYVKIISTKKNIKYASDETKWTCNNKN